MISEPTTRALWGRAAGCFLAVLVPTSWALWGSGACCLSIVRSYHMGTVGQECRLFKWCRNLLLGHCWAGVQSVKVMLESTSPALWGSSAGCLIGVRTYLLVSVEEGCRLFKRCQHLPPRHCWAGVQAVRMELEPTSKALWGLGAGCLQQCQKLSLSGLRTYITGTVGQGCRLFLRVTIYHQCVFGQGCRLFKQYRNLPSNIVGQGCRLFKQLWNLPPWYCGAGYRPLRVSKPTSQAMSGRGKGCLCSVRTYLPGTVV